MMILGMQEDAQCNGFFPGYIYPNTDFNLEANGSFWNVKDCGKILVNGQNFQNEMSSQYQDLFMRHYKEALKQTMLKHESILEDQIQELHRLYWRQKELMVQMKGTTAPNRPLLPETLRLNPCFPRNTSEHVTITCLTNGLPWINTKKSYPKTSAWTQTETSSKIFLFPTTEAKKFSNKVFDLELPASEYLDIEGEKCLQEENIGEVHEMPKESFPTSMTNALCHGCNSLNAEYILDLNEPVKIEEETSDSLGPANPENPENGLHPNKSIVQMESSSKDDEAGNGIDLNASPQDWCEEKPSFLGKIESKQNEEFLSIKSHEKRKLARSSMVVQALPCFNRFVSSSKHSKSSLRSSWPNKKSKCGIKTDKFCNGCKLDLNSWVSEDDDSALKPSFVPEIDFVAPTSPENHEGAQTSMESDNNQGSPLIEVNSNSSCSVDSVQTQSNQENKICIVATDEDEQERTAAEAIVDISSSSIQTVLANSTCIACGNLRWFAKIACSVVDDSNTEFGLSLNGYNCFEGMDYFEDMTLQVTEMKPHEYYSCSSSKLAKTEVTIYDFVPNGSRRGRSRRGRRQHKDLSEVLQSLASLSGNEVRADLQMIGGRIEASGGKRENGSARKRSKNRILAKGRKHSGGSSPNPTETHISPCVHMTEERRAVDWGTITRRRRDRRSPASNIQLILGQAY